MFEKEAEEYTVEHHCKNCWMKDADGDSKCTGLDFCGRNKDWQKGAEFGYNKAKEWHYVKDGDLPKDEKEVLVYMWGSFYIGYYSEKYDENERWHFEDFSEESEQVTVWKEIIPPKED